MKTLSSHFIKAKVGDENDKLFSEEVQPLLISKIESEKKKKEDEDKKSPVKKQTLHRKSTHKAAERKKEIQKEEKENLNECSQSYFDYVNEFIRIYDQSRGFASELSENIGRTLETFRLINVKAMLINLSKILIIRRKGRYQAGGVGRDSMGKNNKPKINSMEFILNVDGFDSDEDAEIINIDLDDFDFGFAKNNFAGKKTNIEEEYLSLSSLGDDNESIDQKSKTVENSITEAPGEKHVQSSRSFLCKTSVKESEIGQTAPQGRNASVKYKYSRFDQKNSIINGSSKKIINKCIKSYEHLPDEASKRVIFKKDTLSDDSDSDSKIADKDDLAKVKSVSEIERDSVEEDPNDDSYFLPKNQAKHNLIEKKVYTPNDVGRNYFQHEAKIILKIYKIINEDLTLTKYFLDGKKLDNIQDRYHIILNNLYANEVPQVWRDEFSQLNLCFKNYCLFIKSLLKKLDSIYSTIISLNTSQPPVIPISRQLDPKTFLINLVWYEGLNSGRSPMDMTISIRPFEGTTESLAIHKLWKLNGIKIRGGKQDLVLGMLNNENKRELTTDIGTVCLEFQGFERSSYDYLEGEPSVPFFVQPKSYAACNMEQDYLKNMAKELRNTQFLYKDLKQDDDEAAKDQVKTIHKFSMAQPLGIMHIVRIPIIFTQVHNALPINDMKFYLYCYSLFPQIYWTQKGTFASIEDFED